MSSETRLTNSEIQEVLISKIKSFDSKIGSLQNEKRRALFSLQIIRDSASSLDLPLRQNRKILEASSFETRLEKHLKKVKSICCDGYEQEDQIFEKLLADKELFAEFILREKSHDDRSSGLNHKKANQGGIYQITEGKLHTIQEDNKIHADLKQIVRMDLSPSQKLNLKTNHNFILDTENTHNQNGSASQFETENNFRCLNFEKSVQNLEPGFSKTQSFEGQFPENESGRYNMEEEPDREYICLSDDDFPDQFNKPGKTDTKPSIKTTKKESRILTKFPDLSEADLLWLGKAFGLKTSNKKSLRMHLSHIKKFLNLGEIDYSLRMDYTREICGVKLEDTRLG